MTEHALTPDDAEVVVVLGALLHDIGMAIHRDDHERFSLILAAPKLRELLNGIYDAAARTAMGYYRAAISACLCESCGMCATERRSGR